METVWPWHRFEPFRFILFWYQKGLLAVWRLGLELILSVWQNTAPLLMLKLLLVPLFGDYTWQGVAIGILMRLARVVVSIFALSSVLLIWLLLLVLWLILPPALVYLILRNLLFK
jgi:hypothetical protein